MHLFDSLKHRGEFEPLMSTALAQVAMMTLKPGRASDDDVRNEHPRCEQWIFVISGSCTATVVPRGKSPRQMRLKRGALLVIQRGERHRIENSGKSLFRAITFYMPPAYDAQGDVLPTAKR